MLVKDQAASYTCKTRIHWPLVRKGLLQNNDLQNRSNDYWLIITHLKAKIKKIKGILRLNRSDFSIVITGWWSPSDSDKIVLSFS